MAWNLCDLRFVLVAAALVFILLQVHLFTTQTEYAERLATAIGAENQCTSHTRMLIDQISMQQEKIVRLEDLNSRYEEESAQLKTLVRDLERKSLQRISGKTEVPVAAVVIMACNRPDYLKRTISSVLKYQSAVPSKFPLFVSQDGASSDVKRAALSYSQITYMQHLDFEPVHTERPGELIAYYKIARHYKWTLDELFLKHNLDRVIILEGQSWLFLLGMITVNCNSCMILRLFIVQNFFLGLDGCCQNPHGRSYHQNGLKLIGMIG